jgi:nucleotide-binding universal stress UspA family protein
MTYKTLMAHLELGHPNAGLLRVAAALAEQFDAEAIGVAMCHPMQVVYSEGYVAGEFIARDQELRDQEIAGAQAEFRAALGQRAQTWRSAITSDPLADWLAREARAADLIITGVDRNVSLFDTSRHMVMGDFVMHAGRPVLIVPATVRAAAFGRVLIGWKDARESRRAIADALPLLRRARKVTLVEIAGEDELAAARARLDDVVLWLGRHGIAAQPAAVVSGQDDTHRLRGLAEEYEADLIVAGAYGHSRVREWVFGGVTRDLLLRAGKCVLVSH